MKRLEQQKQQQDEQLKKEKLKQEQNTSEQQVVSWKRLKIGCYRKWALVFQEMMEKWLKNLWHVSKYTLNLGCYYPRPGVKFI